MIRLLGWSKHTSSIYDVSERVLISGNYIGLLYNRDDRISIGEKNIQVWYPLLNKDNIEYAIKTDIPDMSVYALKTDIPEAFKKLELTIDESQTNVIVIDPKPTKAIKFNHLGTMQTFGVGNLYLTSPEIFIDGQDQMTIRAQTGGTILLKDNDITITGNLKNKNGQEYAFKTQSQTITHLAPIEGYIDDFILCTPVYMPGMVYKYNGTSWQPSTNNDFTDCISSVKPNGEWKEYLGICVEIDKETNSIKFASHGDYLVRVSDSSVYGVGDTVFVDDGILKILSDNEMPTIKITRSIVGIITAIIDETTLAVFKD